jgi:hypothetical protein
MLIELRRAALRHGALAAFLFGLTVIGTQAHAATVNAYACDGKVEMQVWRQWDEIGFPYAKQHLIEKRLIGTGDTYALYDFQIMFHNLLAMAQRCQRAERQVQLLMLVNMAYAQLAVAPDKQLGRAWVCRGGSVCNSTNRLVNKEVMLTSVQFLAFVSSVARGINLGSTSALTRDFVEETVQVVLEHLTRWSALENRMALRKRIAAKPEDVLDGSSALFLTDRDLWQIALYAELGGLIASQPQLAKAVGRDGAVSLALQEHFMLLLRLFAVRTTAQSVADPRDGKTVQLSDLDAGFWRLFAANRYAGYVGHDKPVACNPKVDRPNTFEVVMRIDSALIAPVADLGWDLSHVRRLVHVFDAIERNRSEIAKVFTLAPSELPSRDTMASFARQLRIRVWNQDEAKPLFANYFNGANGWYRVNYDNGTGRCMEGYPPYGLTDAFPTGGFAMWATLDPALGGLAERLYELTRSGRQDEQAFVNTYYPNLSNKAAVNVRKLTEIMFWPTLVRD